MLGELVIILEKYITQLSTSKYMAGIIMLLMNIGGKYISAELSELHEDFLNHKIIRRVLVFVFVFYATKDIKVSLILTATFVVLVSGIFHEESKYCVLPTNTKNKQKINKDEYIAAKQIVSKYEKQKLA